MEYQKLNAENVDLYLAYLHKAMEEDPDEMMTDILEEENIRQRIQDPFFQNTVSLLAVDGVTVVGRIEYHFYGCLQDGYKMAYVDWVYVLPEYRHKGIAQGLFQAFEKECRASGIDQYYLIRAESKNAERFYHAFEAVELTREPMLRKNLHK